jgi:hypothetical protein
MLAAEFERIKSARTERLPELVLCVGLVLSQATRMV